MDEFCLEAGAKPDIVKIDVDGSEVDVVQSGLATLKRARFVLVEVSMDSLAKINFLMSSIGKKGVFIEQMYSKGLGMFYRLMHDSTGLMILYV